MIIEKSESIVRKISGYLEWVGVLGLICMFLTNLIDVIGAKFFKWPLPGALEIISFTQVIAIAPAIAIGLFQGIQLSVDFIVEKFPKPLQKTFAILVSIFCIILSALVFWEGIHYANSLKVSGEAGSVSKLPFYPFAYVFALSWIPVALYYIIDLIKHIRGK